MVRFMTLASRILAAALACGAAGAVTARDAHASVSIAVTFDALVHDSTAAAIVTPVEQRSVWEGGRIYTYTRVHVDQGVAGSLATGGDAWVVSLGGIVGDVGQVVEGEARLHVGYPTFVFLRPDSQLAGTHVVTARAQGQFQIRVDPVTKSRRFIKNHGLGTLLPPRVAGGAAPVLAADVVQDRLVDDVVRDVTAAWTKQHAR